MSNNIPGFMQKFTESLVDSVHSSQLKEGRVLSALKHGAVGAAIGGLTGAGAGALAGAGIGGTGYAMHHGMKSYVGQRATNNRENTAGGRQKTGFFNKVLRRKDPTGSYKQSDPMRVGGKAALRHGLIGMGVGAGVGGIIGGLHGTVGGAVSGAMHGWSAGKKKLPSANTTESFFSRFNEALSEEFRSKRIKEGIGGAIKHGVIGGVLGAAKGAAKGGVSGGVGGGAVVGATSKYHGGEFWKPAAKSGLAAAGVGAAFGGVVGGIGGGLKGAWKGLRNRQYS